MDPGVGPSRCFAAGVGLSALRCWILIAGLVVAGHTAPAAVRGAKSALRLPDAVLVSFKPTVSHASRLNTIAKHSLKADLGRSNPHFARVVLPEKARQNAAAVEATLAALRRDPTVAYAEPDHWLRALAVPNDPMFNDLWGLHNVGQQGSWQDRDVDAPEAWNVTTGSAGVVVAVLDTGVDYNHPDLAANILRNGQGNVVGYDFYANDADPMDEEGHGTHCAGTIGAVGNNGLGVVGVCPTVKIMPVRWLGPDGFGNISDAVRAIDFARQNGARIMNNSWGGAAFSQFLLDAVLRARDAGILFVAAAGNDGTDNDLIPHYPSNYNRDSANVIAVAATTPSDHLAEFSCFGATTVDLAAPGRDILSTVPGNQYARQSGTSMAAPHVAGAAALLLSNNPNLTVDELKLSFVNTTDDVPQLAGRLRIPGRLNVCRALGVATSAPSATGGPDAFEADNSPATATQHVSGQYHTHTLHAPGDEDWFQFVAPAGATVEARTYDLAGGADTMIELYGANGTTLVAQNNNDGQALRSRLLINLAGGGYFLRVRDANGAGNAGATYTVDITWAAPDGFEPDNFPSQAPSAASGQLAAHTFHVAGDVDWVKVSILPGARMVATTSRLIQATDTVLELYDTNGTTLLATDDDGGGGLASRLDRTFSVGGTYFVRVRELFNDGGPGWGYHLNVTVTGGSADTVAPAVTNAQANPATLPGTGGTVALSLTATDGTGTTRAEVEVTWPHGSKTTVPLSLTSGTTFSGTWTGTFNCPANTGSVPQSYSMLFRAFDAALNTGSAGPLSVVVDPQDTTRPVLSGPERARASMPAGGGVVTLTVTAADAVGVTAADAEIIRPDSTRITVPLTRSSGSPTSGTWTGTFTAPANSLTTLQSYGAQFFAQDAAGNRGGPAGPVTFTVAAAGPPDTLKPVLSLPTVAPRSVPASGGTVTLAVTAADAVGATAADAEIIRPDSTRITVPLTRSSGSPTSGTWTGTFTAPANSLTTLQSYGAQFFAQDAAGNRGGPAGPVTFTVAAAGPPDTLKPVLSLPTVAPRSVPASGGTVTLAVTASDLRGIATVRADVTRPNSTKTSLTLIRSTGTATNGTYRGTFAVPANVVALIQTYRVQYFASDGAGNQGQSTLVSFTVARATPPKGKLVLSATSLPFGSVTINAAVRRSFEISNTGPGTLKGTVGTLLAPYSVVAGGGAFSLAPGTKKKIEVQFRPTVRRSTPPFTGSLRITSDDPTRLSAAVAVTGTSR